MNISHVSLALFTLSSLAAAQSVTVRGKVEDVSGAPGQFILDCTNVDLSSSNFDLNQFVGAQVELQGTWNGSTASPAVLVTALQSVGESFEIGGSGQIGTLAKPSVTGTPGSLAITFASLSSSFVPTAGFGTVLLGGIPFHTGSGTIPAGGTRELSVLIPNDSALIGIDIFGQGAIIAAGTVQLTNPDCKTFSG